MLRGTVPAHEAPGLLAAVRSVRGVQSVENELTTSEGVDPGRQGEGRPTLRGLDRLTANWSPGTRLLGATLGGALVLNCLLRGGPRSLFSGTFGVGLLLCAASCPRTLRGTDTAGPVSESEPTESEPTEPTAV